MRICVWFVCFLALLWVSPAFARSNTRPDLSEPAMTVVIVRDSSAECEPLCPQWISAEGRITGATPALFKKTLSDMGKTQLPILIQSGGGEVKAALEIGRMIRQHNLDVAVGWTSFHDTCKPSQRNCKLPQQQNNLYFGIAFQTHAYCNSACPLILASGTHRFASPSSNIGVHQILNVWQQGDKITYRERYYMIHGRKHVVSRTVVSRVKGKSYTTNGLTRGLRQELTVYLNQMGINTSLFADMDKAPPTSIYWMPVPELVKTKLVTSAGAAEELELPSICSLHQFAPVCVLHFNMSSKS